jgi:hypothetical protein
VHAVYLAHVVEWQVFVVAGEFQLELWAVVEHGFVELAGSAAAGRDEGGEEAQAIGCSHGSEYRNPWENGVA